MENYKTKHSITFFKLFRNRGFFETLSLLMAYPNHELLQNTFFNELIKRNAYPNIFFRIKKRLISHKLIGFKLDSNNNKVIFITNKGTQIMTIVSQIENLLANDKGSNK